ncbi:aminoglycoside phosphotransferase (APT) family kinase protein [Micromonospora sp. HB375]|uniref:phosphotransferase enzyme family protein n=1 Tax=unclassified Micromonospora TaxID=2617518 RepID=UPI001AE99E53|nr:MULTISPECIES: aminoglycoside phosphotransferase family protein [unclassified Micromonospora]MBP1781167.1 aminoglycoside phosphotransferase (APT) family kinase protein [Micromonospora sp. HB375]MDH6471169.1 aminoglycoside phosphotransferase (APT) family kinase protein [Micromonospora sp. H404/HB375]
MNGRFSEEAMTLAMREIAGGLEVPTEDARLLRLTNNAVFALPESGLVIRIARTHRLRGRVTKVVQLARWFAELDAPTIRLAPGVAQPVAVGDLVASVWVYVPPAAPTPTMNDLGSALRRFHALGPPPFPLATWDPIGDARRRLADADGLTAEDHDYLAAWCDRLEPQVADLNQRGEQSLIHGDAHVGNLLRDASRGILLCDFDATCLGPWQVDLAAVAVGEVRFGKTGAHRALAEAYGYDVMSDRNWPLLREARELKMIAAATPLLASSTRVSAEFASRLRSIRYDNPTKVWKPFADLT